MQILNSISPIDILPHHFDEGVRKSPFLARPAGGGTKDKKFQFEGKIGWRPLLKNGPFNNWLTAFENIRTDFYQ